MPGTRAAIRLTAVGLAVAAQFTAGALYAGEEKTEVTRGETQAVSTAGNRTLAEARRHVAAMKTSTYQRRTDVDEKAGRYNLDCSAFVAMVMAKAAPGTLAATPITGKKRWRAADFHDAIAGAPAWSRDDGTPGWRRVADPTAAQPGDLVAWRKEDPDADETSGHVMIVAEAPVKEADGQLRLRVIDSSSRPHGHDTRRDGTNGLGTGVIWLDLDVHGGIAGFRLRASNSPLNRLPMVVGRATEAAAPVPETKPGSP